MRSDDLLVFLAGYAAATLALLILGSFYRKTWLNVIGLATALIAVVAMTVLGSYLEPGRSTLDLLAEMVSDRSPRHLVSAAIGAAAAGPWLARVFIPTGSRHSRRPELLEQLVIVASIAGVVGGAGLMLWDAIFDIKKASSARVLAPEFTIDEIAAFEFYPTRVAVDDDGGVYVSYFWSRENATHGGAIVKLVEDPETGTFTTKTVANHDILFRAIGLAFKDGDLYVSRSGYDAKADSGRITYADAAAVTQLKDLNGDGYFEYYDDILTGMPGGRGPHIQHQNNGIVFGLDGSLYVTIGVASIGIDEHPWGGALLKLSPDFEKAEVFATGFRNSFGIAVNDVDEVFLTDNDSEENAGDELDHVIKGEHYGHPFYYPNHPGKTPVGFRDEIMIARGTPHNYVGMAYTNSPGLPEKFRDCLYIANISGNELVRVRVAPAGDSYEVTEFERFASIPTALDVAITRDGTMYVISRYDQKLFRIRLRDGVPDQGGEP